jgi:hypothetical protein
VLKMLYCVVWIQMSTMWPRMLTVSQTGVCGNAVTEVEHAAAFLTCIKMMHGWGAVAS